jgi:hypothetical protein
MSQHQVGYIRRPGYYYAPVKVSINYALPNIYPFHLNAESNTPFTLAEALGNLEYIGENSTLVKGKVQFGSAVYWVGRLLAGLAIVNLIPLILSGRGLGQNTYIIIAIITPIVLAILWFGMRRNREQLLRVIQTTPQTNSPIIHD